MIIVALFLCHCLQFLHNELNVIIFSVYIVGCGGQCRWKIHAEHNTSTQI